MHQTKLQWRFTETNMRIDVNKSSNNRADTREVTRNVLIQNLIKRATQFAQRSGSSELFS